MLDRKKVLILDPSPIFGRTLKEVIHIALPKENGIEFIASIKAWFPTAASLFCPVLIQCNTKPPRLRKERTIFFPRKTPQACA
jgi:hypothetical protein